MEYENIEPNIRAYVKKSVYNTLDEDGKKIYMKAVKYTIKKMDKISVEKVSDKLSGTSIGPIAMEVMFVGTELYGDHEFNPHDDIRLVEYDEDKDNPSCIRVMLRKRNKWKHVADVDGSDANILRKYGGNYMENELIYLRRYGNKYKYRVLL